MPSLKWLLPGPHHPHTALPSPESHCSHWTASSYTNQCFPSALGSPWFLLIFLALPSNVPSWFSLLRWLHLKGVPVSTSTTTCYSDLLGQFVFCNYLFYITTTSPNFTKEGRALHHSHRHSRCTLGTRVFNKYGKLSEWPQPSLSLHCPMMIESPRNKEKS